MQVILFVQRAIVLVILIHNTLVECSVQDYIKGISKYFGYDQGNQDNELYAGEFMQTIPYEVSTIDEKFISEAVKLTGVAISDLDSCQQRVVLKLKSDCDKMNDEQLAKMAVQLLNCQSYIEGRKIFPCTNEMSLKDCTSNMDADTWTSYHLMSNRARAVCYMVRQTQFRGLAQHTVNSLMEASKNQLRSLGRIADNQENILNLAENTYDSLSKAQEQLSEQQKDMQHAQFHGQLMLENNIMKLVDEKRLIHETQNKLIQMTMEVQNKLESSAELIAVQNTESQINHKELLEDIMNIRKKANDLFEKIDAYSEILLTQNEEFKNQYESTLRNLQEVNQTVHTLVNLVGGTRQALEERLSWVMTALGGTDEAVDRLYLVLWHIGLVLIAMLGSAFLSARPSTRLAIVTLPPLNLAMALYGNEYFDFVSLIVVIGGLISAQTVIIWSMHFHKSRPEAIAFNQSKSSSLSSLYHEVSNLKSFNKNLVDQEDNESTGNNEIDHFNEEFHSLTPPISRNGHYSGIRSRSRSNTPLNLNRSFRSTCGAKTRAGTPCKLSSLPGRDCCYRHQSGDSIMG